MAEFVVKIADERGHLHSRSSRATRWPRCATALPRRAIWSTGSSRRACSRAGFRLRRRRKLKQGPFLVFNQQFLTLIKAGLPILNSLDLLIKRQKDAHLEADSGECAGAGEGRRIAFGRLRRATRMVPKIYTTTLMAGEKSGNIDEVLTRYINFQRLAMTFRKKLFVSLIYPTLLVTVVTIMVMFLFTYVVPKFAELFNSLDAKLPAITLFMLAVGKNAQKYFPFIAVRAGAVWICSSGGGRRRIAERTRLTG